jgi:hypothetical protein
VSRRTPAEAIRKTDQGVRDAGPLLLCRIKIMSMIAADSAVPDFTAPDFVAFDIIITPHLTLRPLHDVDGDDIRALLVETPELLSAMPDDVRRLADGHALAERHGVSPQARTLAVMRERMIGWIAADGAQTGFSSRIAEAGLKDEALAAARRSRAA